jgi:hypothetical protein
MAIFIGDFQFAATATRCAGYGSNSLQTPLVLQ